MSVPSPTDPSGAGVSPRVGTGGPTADVATEAAAPTIDEDALRIAREVLAKRDVVELVAERYHRLVDPMCPSLMEKGDGAEMYRDEARRAVAAVLVEGLAGAPTPVATAEPAGEAAERATSGTVDQARRELRRITWWLATFASGLAAGGNRDAAVEVERRAERLRALDTGVLARLFAPVDRVTVAKALAVADVVFDVDDERWVHPNWTEALRMADVAIAAQPAEDAREIARQLDRITGTEDGGEA